MTTVFHAKLAGGFIKTKHRLEGKKLHRTNSNLAQ